MADPLSPLASVITIAGSASESVRVFLTFLHQFRNAPAQVRQWLIMLESLRSTLSDLQQCGRNLESRHRFSSHFRQRLVSCVAQLQVCTSEVTRIDAEIAKANAHGPIKWDRKARRAWERAKWAFFGDHKINKVMRILDLYHFEFAMELLKMQM